MRRAPHTPLTGACARPTSDEARANRKANSRQRGAYSWSPSGLVSVRHVDTGEGPLHGERLHLRAELLDELEALLALRWHSRDAHEVLEQLRAGLLLQEQRELHGAVQGRSATTLMSSSRMSRDVSADVPRRIPPGTCADASPETAFSVGLRKQLGKGRLGARVRTVDGDAHEIATPSRPCCQ